MSPTLQGERAQDSSTCPSGGWLILDPGAFLPRFNRQACWVHHHLVDHPLFELPRLLELAKSLPSKFVRINSGNVRVDATPDQIPGTGLSIEESFSRLAESDTRIMLKSIELDPDYHALLHTCLGEIEALRHPATRGVWAREGYIFLSAPNMTTPYHMDPEINFLLQTRGRKTFFVLSGADRSILSEEEIELYYAGLHDHLTFREEVAGKAVEFDMAPGSGVHIPVNHPHWVKTDSEVTISFALTLQTAETKRRGAIYAVNHALRRRGLRPTPYGQSALRDFVKYQSYRVGRLLKSWLRRDHRTAPEH
jgi:hypothetical protein